MAFSILTTIAFALFLLVVLTKYYFKDNEFCGRDLNNDSLHHFCLIAGLILLIIAVWVYPPAVASQ